MAAQGPSAGPLGEPPDVPMEEAAAASEPPQSESRSTAAIEPDERSDESESSELDDMEWLRHNDMEFEDWYRVHGDSAQPDELRARREVAKRMRSEWKASPEGVACNAEVDALLARSAAAWGLASDVGQLEFDQRTELMFKVDSSGPVASGRLPLVQIVTKEQLSFAWKAIEACMKQRGRELSRAYGNFDKYVGFGWLLGDVQCGRLIDGTVAYTVGRKLGKRAPGLKAEFDAPLRRVGKHSHKDDETCERERAAAAEEEARLRREPVDTGLEEGAAALAAPTPAASTSEMPPPPPRPPPRPPQPPPRSERVELLKALREAEAVVIQAEGAVAATKRDRDQAQVAWQYAREQAANRHVISQISDDKLKWKAWNQQQETNMQICRARLRAAVDAVGAAEQAQFWAKHEAKEARIEYDEYEKAQRREGRRRAKEAEEEKKWRQIAEGINHNNAMHAPGDPKYWEPDAWEYTQLHRMWKLSYDAGCE